MGKAPVTALARRDGRAQLLHDTAGAMTDNGCRLCTEWEAAKEEVEAERDALKADAERLFDAAYALARSVQALLKPDLDLSDEACEVLESEAHDALALWQRAFESYGKVVRA